MLQSKKVIPTHVGILLDGNRKWAALNGLEKEDGHMCGKENIKKISIAAVKMGIEYLTMYAFSIENWKRDEEEVRNLINIIDELFKEIEFFVDNDICVKVIGRRMDLEEGLRGDIENLEASTRHGSNLTLTIAFNYGGFDEIVSAARKLLDVSYDLQVDKLTENLINRYMQSNYLPELNLVIRTGNVKRLSRFLIWKSSNAELIFMNKYWPDFNETDLAWCLEEYNKRKRIEG